MVRFVVYVVCGINNLIDIPNDFASDDGLVCLFDKSQRMLSKFYRSNQRMKRSPTLELFIKHGRISQLHIITDLAGLASSPANGTTNNIRSHPVDIVTKAGSPVTQKRGNRRLIGQWGRCHDKQTFGQVVAQGSTGEKGVFECIVIRSCGVFQHDSCNNKGHE